MSDSFKYNPYYDKKYRNRDNDSEDWSYNIDGTIKYNDKSNDIDKLNKVKIIKTLIISILFLLLFFFFFLIKKKK